MALNNSSADAVAVAICAALTPAVTDPTAIANWKVVMRQIWAGIVADEVVTLAANSVITVGSPSTQTGPTTPVVLTVS